MGRSAVAKTARRRGRPSALSALSREIRHRGLRPWDRLGFALSGLRPGGRDAWLDRRLMVEARYGWLFVLGVNNSGTTILRQLLEAHPEVRSLGREGVAETRAFPRASELGFSRLWSLEPDLFRMTEKDSGALSFRARFDWSRLYPRRSGYLLEKSPPNTLRSRWLQRYFRPARFLAIVRHPYAACEGIDRRTGCGLETAARHWTAANETLLDDWEHLERKHLVRYEHLTEHTEAELDALEAFLGLAAPLDRSTTSSVGTHSIEGKTMGLTNLNTRSLARLGEADLDLIDCVAGRVMERLGYTRGNADSTEA